MCNTFLNVLSYSSGVSSCQRCKWVWVHRQPLQGLAAAAERPGPVPLQCAGIPLQSVWAAGTRQQQRNRELCTKDLWCLLPHVQQNHSQWSWCNSCLQVLNWWVNWNAGGLFLLCRSPLTQNTIQRNKRWCADSCQAQRGQKSHSPSSCTRQEFFLPPLSYLLKRSPEMSTHQ